MKLFLSLARARVIVSKWYTAAAYMAVVIAVYVVGYLLLHPFAGESASALVLVPVLGFGVVYGVKGGVIAGLAGFLGTSLLLSISVPGPSFFAYLGSGEVIFPNVIVTAGGALMGWLRDLSDRLLREMEQAQALATQLEESEERYYLASTGTTDGIWDWDIPSHRMFYSSRWAELLGLTFEKLSADPREWLDRVHPADREPLRDYLATQFVSDTRVLVSEHRLRHQQGHYLWVHARAAVIRNSRGRVTRVVGSISDITERTVRDPLTRLPNQLLFLEQLSLMRNQRPESTTGGAYTVAMVDIDGFSFLNGTIGPAACDNILVTIGRQIGDTLRAGDVLARGESDRFLVALSGIGDDAEIDIAMRRILTAGAGSLLLDGKETHFKVTAGAVAVTDSNLDNDGVLRAAELSLKQAKDNARGSYVLYSKNMHRSALSQFELLGDLRHAAERGELQLVFQPIVSLPTKHTVAAEVLLRWNHPRHGLLSPGSFIHIAETGGLIVELSQWLLGETVRHITELRALGHNDVRLDVNLSGSHFAAEHDLPRYMEGLLTRASLPPRLLGIEITETSLVGNQDEAIDVLNTIGELGVHRAIDDFGTGYSTLEYLRRLPVDTVKIDRSFVTHSVGNRRDRAMLSSLVQLGRSVELTTLAEGVEHGAQLSLLSELGCDFAQGFFLARPLEWEAFKKQLGSRLPATG